MTRESRMISGRVPTTVTTLSFFVLDAGTDRVGSGAVEILVSPDHHHHLVLADIGDVVHPARNGLDNLWPLARSEERVRLVREQVSKPKARLSLDHQKLLGLAVMVMRTARYAGPHGKRRELPGILGLHYLDEHAAGVRILRDRVGEAIRRHVADVRGIERSRQPRAHALGNEGFAARLESLAPPGRL